MSWIAAAGAGLSILGGAQGTFTQTYNDAMSRFTEQFHNINEKLTSEKLVNAIDREKVLSNIQIDAAVREAEAQAVVQRAVSGGEGTEVVNDIKAQGEWQRVNAAKTLDAEIEPEVRKAEGILDHIETIAEEEDYELETDLLQSREVGPTIVDEAVEHEVDLILMGVKYKTRFGQFSLGNVVPYVLKNAPCRVILYHQYTE